MVMANAKRPGKKRVAAKPAKKGGAQSGSEYSLGKFGGGKVTDRGKKTR